MKPKIIVSKKLQNVRAVLLTAVSGLDPRGTDAQITKAMCIIEGVFDATIAGKPISSTRALSRGIALAAKSLAE